MTGSIISVLYVDDEAALLDIGRIFLERGGQFSVTTAVSARTALSLMETTRFDIIVSDYQMPVMDGITLLKTVRHSSDIPFILFTGKGREEVVIEAINSGADFYIQKGGDPTAQFTELAHKIRLAVERRRAEAALREKTDEVDRYFSSSLDLLCIADLDGRFRRLNPEWERLLGYPVAELVGRRFLDYVHPDDLPATLDVITRLAAQEEIHNFVNRCRCSDGSYRWIEWRAYPSGNLIYASARDITDRIAAEEALRNSERRLLDLINFLPDATFAIDRHGKVIAWNHAIEQMTDVPAGKILGKGEYDYAIPFYGERRPILIDLVLGEHPEIEKKYPFIHRKDNKLISEIFVPLLNRGTGAYLWFTASPLYDTRGGIVGAIESIRDITDRKKAEDALRAAEGKLSTIFRSSPDIITISELDTGRFLDVNDAAVRIFGYERGEFTGKSALEMGIWINPEDRAALIDRIRSEGKVQRFETRQRRKNGEVFVAAISAGTILLGGTRYLISTIRDISEMKRTEQALKESEERYRNVVEGQTEFISRFTPDGIHVFANDAYLRYFGIARQDLIGHRFVPVIPGEDAARVRNHFVSLSRQNPSATIEHRIVMSDGSIRWQQWNDTAVFDDKGTIVEYQSVGRDITSRKLAEEQVLASEERYRSLAEASPDLIFVIDADDQVSYVNTAAVRMIGLSREQIIGIPRERLFPPEISRHQRAQIENVFASQKPVHTEGPLTFSGREYHFDHYLVPINDQEGRTTAVLGISRDITERRRMERALSDSERKYRSVIENLQDAFYRADNNGNITMVSPSAVEMTGYVSEKEVIGLNLTRDLYMDPSQRADFLEAIAKTGRVKDFEAVLKKKDGTPFVVSTSAHVCRDAEGNVTGIEGIAKDITELKETEEALQKSEEKFRTILDTTSEWIWEVDVNGRHTYTNAACDAILGYRPEELLEADGFNLMHPDDRQRIVTLFEEAKAGRKGWRNVVIRWRHKDGKYRYLESNATPVFDAAGVMTGFKGADRDITVRVEALQALKESEEKYRALVESSFDGIAIHQDGVVVYANQAAIRLLGGTMSKDIIGKPAMSFVHPDYYAVVESRVAAATTTVQQVLHEKFLRLDGGFIDVDVATTPCIWDGRPAGHVVFRDVTARVQAEEALSESEAKLREAQGIARMGRWELDLNANHLTWSDSIFDLFGVSRETFTASYEAFLSLIHPDDRAMVDRTYRKSVENRTPYEVEHRLLMPDGRIKWVNEIGRTDYDAAGNPLRSVGTVQDITGRKRAEEALRKSEERYETLISISPDAIIVHRYDGTILYANTAAADLLHVPDPGILIGKSILTFVDPASIAEVRERIGSIIHGEKVAKPARSSFVTTDGSPFFAETAGTNIEFDGQPAILVIARDITDRIHAEEALRKSESRLSSIIRVAPIGIGVVSNRIILSANERLCRMIGYREEELVGNSARILYPTQEDYEYVGREKYAQIERTGSGSVETRFITKDGTILDILLSSTPIDPGDLSAEVTFTALDISSLRQATYNLQQRNEEISATLTELTAREEELRKSYEELARVEKETRELNDSLPDIIYRADTRGNITYMNRKGLELFEVLYEEMINKPFLPNIHPDDLPAAAAVYRHLIETGEPVTDFECRFVARRGKGRVFPVIQNVSAIRDGQGRILGTQGIAIDISEKKRAENTLKENEARMRRILNQVPGTLWTTDASLVFTSSYGAALPKIGLEPDQVVGRSLEAFYEGQPGRDQALRAHHRALAGETVAYDAQYGDRTFLAHVEPMRSADGQITGTLGIAFDKTEIQQAEEVIRKSEELYRSLVDATPDGICITNREGTIAYASSRAVSLFGGGSPDEAIGSSIFDWIAAEDRDRAKEELRKVMNGMRQPASTYRAVRRDGSAFWAEVSVSVIQDAHGGISGMVASIRDITDRIGSQEALRKANTKLTLLASITRHDILNKLMVIEGYLALLKETTDPRQAQAFMEKIGTAAGVIKNILAFTKDYQNMGVRAPEWLDAGTVFARQLEEFDTGSISVKNTLLGVQIYADPLLEKVMYNLIDNALRYGRNLTQITASYMYQGHDLVCIIEDNGGGIPLADKDRIFERGFGKGTGLGLFLVREILAVTGMTIRETGKPDEGARFEILVPKGEFRIG